MSNITDQWINMQFMFITSWLNLCDNTLQNGKKSPLFKLQHYLKKKSDIDRFFVKEIDKKHSFCITKKSQSILSMSFVRKKVKQLTRLQSFHSSETHSLNPLTSFAISKFWCNTLLPPLHIESLFYIKFSPTNNSIIRIPADFVNILSIVIQI